MFSFFKNKNIPRLTVDIHSHLIPSIDDGVQSLEESLTLLKKMESLGYLKVITTPHIMLDSYKNTPKIINDGLNLVKEEIEKENINIEIEAGAEYYLDEGLINHLNSKKLMNINNYLLFETSYVARPMQLEETIFEISSSGYTPLLAHPERYRYIKNPKEEYKKLKDMGVMFQCNLNSLGGHYGKSAKQNIDFLSKAGMIDFLGSDAHNINHILKLEKVLTSSSYINLFKKNSIKNEELV